MVILSRECLLLCMQLIFIQKESSTGNWTKMGYYSEIQRLNIFMSFIFLYFSSIFQWCSFPDIEINWSGALKLQNFSTHCVDFFNNLIWKHLIFCHILMRKLYIIQKTSPGKYQIISNKPLHFLLCFHHHRHFTNSPHFPAAYLKVYIMCPKRAKTVKCDPYANEKGKKLQNNTCYWDGKIPGGMGCVLDRVLCQKYHINCSILWRRSDRTW